MQATSSLIRFIAHKEIDLSRWDNAIQSAENGLPYALSGYLNLTTNKKWAALVQGDYEHVMPLPYNHRLFGIPRIYQPILTQQLGIFGPNISADLVSRFALEIPRKFKIVDTYFNYGNATNQPGFHPKLNLIKHIPNTEEDLRNSYSKSLGKNIRKATKNYVFKHTNDISNLIQIYRLELEEKVNFGASNYALAHQVFQFLLDHQYGKIYSVFRDEKLVASGLFITFRDRIINVFGASVQPGEAPHAMAFLIHNVLVENLGTHFIFDFEGSEIPGVRSFFESFGTEPQYYYPFHRKAEFKRKT